MHTPPAASHDPATPPRRSRTMSGPRQLAASKPSPRAATTPAPTLLPDASGMGNTSVMRCSHGGHAFEPKDHRRRGEGKPTKHRDADGPHGVRERTRPLRRSA